MMTKHPTNRLQRILTEVKKHKDDLGLDETKKKEADRASRVWRKRVKEALRDKESYCELSSFDSAKDTDN